MFRRSRRPCNESNSDQCDICKRAQCYHSDFSRVKVCLFHQKSCCRLFNWLSFWRREVLVSKSIRTMNKISNTKFCTLLYSYKWKQSASYEFQSHSHIYVRQLIGNERPGSMRRYSYCDMGSFSHGNISSPCKLQLNQTQSNNQMPD